jgi:hypothetical protein
VYSMDDLCPKNTAMIERELLRGGSFCSFLLSIDRDLAELALQKACSCRVPWSPALCQLPASTVRVPCDHPQGGWLERAAGSSLEEAARLGECSSDPP